MTEKKFIAHSSTKHFNGIPFETHRSMNAKPKWQESERKNRESEKSGKGWIGQQQQQQSAFMVHKIRLWYCQSVNLHTDKNKATWTADFQLFFFFFVRSRFIYSPNERQWPHFFLVLFDLQIAHPSTHNPSVYGCLCLFLSSFRLFCFVHFGWAEWHWWPFGVGFHNTHGFGIPQYKVKESCNRQLFVVIRFIFSVSLARSLISRRNVRQIRFDSEKQTHSPWSRRRWMTGFSASTLQVNG